MAPKIRAALVTTYTLSILDQDIAKPDQITIRKIKLNTKTLKDGEIKIKEGHTKSKVTVSDIEWVNAPSDEGELRELARHSKTNHRFAIKLEPNVSSPGSFKVTITVKPPVAPLAPAVVGLPVVDLSPIAIKLTQTLNLLSCDTPHDLVMASRAKDHDPATGEALSGVVNRFINDEVIPDENTLNIILEIAEDISDEDKKRIIEKLARNTYTGIMLKEPMLKCLTKILIKFQRSLYRKAFSDAKTDLVKKLEESELSKLKPSELVELMDAIADKLEASHATAEAVFPYLSALVALLDIMMITGVNDVERKKYHEKFYKVIGKYADHKFGDHRELRVSFLGSYGKQCFNVVKNDESGKEQFFRRMFHVIKLVGIIGKSISITEPWQALEIISSAEALKELKGAFGFQELRKVWFDDLTWLQYCFLQSNVQGLKKFKEKLDQDINYAREKLPQRHDPMFVYGAVKLFENVVETHANEHPEMAEIAIALLEKVGSDNQKIPEEELKKMAHKPFFWADDKEYSPQVEQEVFHLLTHYSAHSEPKVANAANESLARIQKLREKSSHKPLSTKLTQGTDVKPASSAAMKPVAPSIEADPLSKDTIFAHGLKRALPMLEGLRNLKRFLSSRDQVVEEWEYVIALQGKETGDASGTDMKKKLNEVLKNKRAVLVLGDSGSGKSLFSMLNVLEGLENFCFSRLSGQPQPTPVPLYVSLRSLVNPETRLIDETLEQHGLISERENLKKRPTVWFLDGYDEMFIGGRLKDKINLSSQFAEHWPQAQLVITCRRDFLQSGDERYFTPSKGSSTTIYVDRFDETKVHDYLEKYIEVRKKVDKTKSAPPKLWTDVKKYEEYIKKLGLGVVKGREGVEGVVSNVFNLKITADTLPTIVERHLENKKSESEVLEVTQPDLYDEYICQRFNEEYRRQFSKIQTGPILVGNMVEYLDFAIELTRYMQICKVRSVGPQDQELLNKNARLYVEEQNEKIKQIIESETRREALAAKEIQEIDGLQLDSSEKDLKKREIHERREKQKTEAEKDQLAARKNIKDAEDADKKLYATIFDITPKTITLRRACFLVKKDGGRIGFMHESIYEHFRRIDNLNRTKIRERLDKSSNSGITL